MSELDVWQALQILQCRSFDFALIQKQYRKLVMALHPDKWVTDEGRAIATRETAKINAAFAFVKMNKELLLHMQELGNYKKAKKKFHDELRKAKLELDSAYERLAELESARLAHTARTLREELDKALASNDPQYVKKVINRIMLAAYVRERNDTIPRERWDPLYWP